MDERTEIIRSLIKQRVKHLKLVNNDISLGEVDSFSPLMVWGSPEGTIFNIIQTFFFDSKNGKSEIQIIKEIDQASKEIEGVNTDRIYKIPSLPNNINAYIFLRLNREFPMIAHFYDDNFIQYCRNTIAKEMGYMQKFSYQEIKDIGYHSFIEMMVNKLNEVGIKPRTYHEFLFDETDPVSSFMGGICNSYSAIEYLKNIGLLNNGVCPMCGKRPIDNKNTFTSGYNHNISFYICKGCYNEGVGISVNPKSDKGGCYIATACYGDYESIEVIEFRKFRDEKLSKTWIGKTFILFYYFISPSIAEWLKDKKGLNNWIKINLFDRIYIRLKK